MTGLQRYFIRQFIWYFIVITGGLSVFFSAIHLIDDLNKLMPYNPTITSLALYTVLIAPRYVLYLLPMSTLLCTILTFAIAAKRKEVIAYKAAGGDIRKLLIPFVMAGIVISMADLVLSEYVVPVSNKKVNDLAYKIREGKKRLHLKQGDIWLKGEEEMIIHADIFVPSEKILRKVILFDFKDNRPSSMMYAKEAAWVGDRWILRDITTYDFVQGKVEDQDKKEIKGRRGPEVFSERVSTPEEMSMLEILDYRKRLEAAGYKNRQLDVDMFSKIVYPFTCFFMMLIGFSLALKRDFHSGLVGVAAGVIISLVYWFLYTFMISLGYAGVVPPLIAALIVPLLFTATGLIMAKNIPR